MIEAWVIDLGIRFALRQLAKFGAETDWIKVRGDAQTRIRQIVPGTVFDDVTAQCVDALLDGLRTVLEKPGQLGAMLSRLANADWSGALASSRLLLIDVWDPSSVQGHGALSALRGKA